VIDTHCHVLAGLDDGPAEDGEALELARALVADGVTVAVCTPHYSRGFPTDHADAQAAHERLRSILAAEGVPLELVLAAEVGPVHALDAPVDELARRALAKRFLVVEVTPDTPAPFFASLAARLEPEGLLPVLAHPERSRALQRSLAPLDEARRAGAVAQLVAPSLLGRWSETVARTAWQIVEEGLADLLASDAHGAARRRPHLAEAAGEIGRRFGRSAVRWLTEDNPGRVVRGVEPQG
jgi:protein-tyrosine phosphatase